MPQKQNSDFSEIARLARRLVTLDRLGAIAYADRLRSKAFRMTMSYELTKKKDRELCREIKSLNRASTAIVSAVQLSIQLD